MKVRDVLKLLNRFQARVDALEELCAEVYQFAGTVGAPVRVLDALNAAAEGRELPAGSLLPISLNECADVRPQLAAAVLGRRGGRVTSVAKRRASKRNAKAGGRPPKFVPGDRVVGLEKAPASLRFRTGRIVERTPNRSEFYVRFDDRPKQPEAVFSWWIAKVVATAAATVR